MLGNYVRWPPPPPPTTTTTSSSVVHRGRIRVNSFFFPFLSPPTFPSPAHLLSHHARFISPILLLLHSLFSSPLQFFGFRECSLEVRGERYFGGRKTRSLDRGDDDDEELPKVVWDRLSLRSQFRLSPALDVLSFTALAASSAAKPIRKISLFCSVLSPADTDLLPSFLPSSFPLPLTF